MPDTEIPSQIFLSHLREKTMMLQDTGRGNIRVHPNGFIQLDLEDTADGWNASKQRGTSGAMRRLHVWNPPGHELPHQLTVNEVHDHVFDMKSTVIRGRLCQIRWDFKTERPVWFDVPEIPPFEKYVAVYDKTSSSRLQTTGEVGWLDLNHLVWVEAGQTYVQPAFTLHDTQPDGCVVTVMTKEKVHEGDATVICRVDTPPDNDFKRDEAADPDYLWSAVKAALTP